MKERAMIKAVRAAVRDVAYPFRMGAGFPGDVTRTHPASIYPAKIDNFAPPTLYGQALLIATDGSQGVRPMTAGDNGVTGVYGFLVRPFPQQAPAGSSNAQQGIGNAVPPTSGACDVLRQGSIIVQLNANQAAPVKGGAVFVRTAATAGQAIQGNFETANDGANNADLDVTRYLFEGGMDSNFCAEISVR